MTRTVAAVLAAGLSLAGLPARPPALAVRWSPEQPTQGSFVLFTAENDDPADPVWSVRGELAGEPLHFETDGTGVLSALGAVPIDAGAALPLTLLVVRSDRTDTLALTVPVARGRFLRERLTVDRRFSDPPDSTLRARIDQEAALVSAVYRRTHGTPRLWTAGFEQPRQSRISSVFGTGREFNGVLQSRHMGVDFTGRIGDPIRATNDGLVALVGHLYYSGNSVFLDHGRGLVTAYFHMSEALVAPGDTVRKGQVIGRVGMTGRVTGPHLHWFAKYGRISVDPMGLLKIGVMRGRERVPSDSGAAEVTR